jgi:acyl carrier protein
MSTGPRAEVSKCPNCRYRLVAEFAHPSGLVICPRCAHMFQRSADALVPTGRADHDSVSRMRRSGRTDGPLSPQARERIVDVIAKKRGVPAEDIRASLESMTDLGADSLDVVELIMAIEEEYGVEIDDV